MKEFYEGSWFEKDGIVNFMKVGIMFADKITTVSPNYAKEIRMAYYSEGLQDVLNDRGGDLVGILNGVYYPDWNPKSDPLIAHNYSPKSINKKKKNKFEFLKSYGLNESDNLDLPLFGMVSRLTEQKGVDIIKEKLDYYLENRNVRFALLGSGQQEYVEFFNYLKWKYPKNAFINIGYDEALAHRIFAASDFIMVPSRFEPCGLTQMYSLKYGTIPVVRATGGLVDTVFEYNSESKHGTGFVFQNFHKDDFAFAMERALSVYYSPSDWEAIRQNAMKEDFSSVRQAHEYIEVFKWAIEKA
jgi:starch synthase